MGIAIPIIGDLIKGAKDIIGEVVVDKDKRAQIAFELDRLELEYADKAAQRETDVQLGQIGINKVEAASSNMFVAGWRPAVGWVGVTALGYNYVAYPLGMFISRLLGYTGSFPTLDNEAMWTLLAGLLGIGGFRTFEKVKGVSVKEPEPSPPANSTS